MPHKYLSHFLNSEIPVYGNAGASINLQPVKRIEKGDSSNTFRFTMENHWGTHIDAPAHFFAGAPSLSDYPADFWRFRNPQVVEVPADENALITVKSLDGRLGAESDILLIKTGFQAWRGQEKYCVCNPGFSHEAGLWLRKYYKTLRAVGFDFISLSPYQNKEEGRKAHRTFLDPSGENHPVLIIEDMDLEGDLSFMKQVWVAPWLIKGVDSAPCTVLGLG